MKRSVRRLILFGLVPLWALGVACGGPPTVNVLTPAHGSFSTAANVTLTGNVQNVGFGTHTCS